MPDKRPIPSIVGTQNQGASKRSFSKPKERQSSNLFTPGLGSQNHTSEVRVNAAQIQGLQNLFETHPTLVAAKSVLEAQLLSSGLVLKRNGNVVDLAPQFRQHIDTHWLQFARDVLSSILVAGYAVVSYEEESQNCATTPHRNRVQDTSSSRGVHSRLQDAGNTGGALRKVTMVPVVVSYAACQIGFQMGGRSNYQRIYQIHRHGHDDALTTDEESILYIRSPPDEFGNVNSPMAAVAPVSSFVDGLVDMASNAEAARAQPALITQLKKTDNGHGASAADMFFDSESRAINSEQSGREDETAALALQMQLRLCQTLNRQSMGNMHAGIGSGQSTSGVNSSAAQQTMAARMVTLPTNQEVAPHIPIPQTRSDLEPLLRLSVDYMCTAIGVPSSLLFDGRFASQTSAQLSLLNATVSQLSKFIDQVLTDSFLDLYPDEGSFTTSKKVGKGDSRAPALELVTTTSPLSATGEVLSLFQGGLADYESAAPLALHSIGLSAVDIEAALKRHKEEVEKLARETAAASALPVESKKAATESKKAATEPERGSAPGGKGDSQV